MDQTRTCSKSSFGLLKPTCDTRVITPHTQREWGKVIGCGVHIYVTGFGKRDLITQIIIFLYRHFSATTPKNNSRDKTFVFVSEVSTTLCLHSR